MQSIKFTTIVSLLLLGAMARGPKPSSPHGQLPASANVELKSDLEDAPSGATLHTTPKAPKTIKLPNKLIKAASAKSRSPEPEHEDHDSKPHSTESKINGEKIDDFANLDSKSEDEDFGKGRSEEEAKLPSLAKLLSSDSLPSQALINKAREEIEKRLKGNQADIKREVAALMVLSQEQSIVDQMNKIKIVAPLELSDMFLASQNSFGSQFPTGDPLFSILAQPGPVTAGGSDLSSSKSSDKSEEEEERPSRKLHASSINKPTIIPSRGSERPGGEHTVELIEQDKELDTTHSSQGADQSGSPMPHSTPAPEAFSIPAKPADTQEAPEAPSTSSTGPQSAPNAPNAPNTPPQTNQQQQPQEPQQPLPQNQPPAPSDPKANAVNTEGTATE